MANATAKFLLSIGGVFSSHFIYPITSAQRQTYVQGSCYLQEHPGRFSDPRSAQPCEKILQTDVRAAKSAAVKFLAS